MKAGQLPNIVAVNLFAECLVCGWLVGGSPYWSLRTSAGLHLESCPNARFRLS